MFEPKPIDSRDPSLETGMFAVLAALLAHAQGAVAARDGPPPVRAIEGRELLGMLERLQRGEIGPLGPDAEVELAPVLREAGNLQNVLRRLKGTRLAAGLAPSDATMLELVAMLFDGILEDPRVPVALKALLGRLQLPILRAALTDKALFEGGPHPVRRLVDSVGQLGLRLPRDFNAASAVFPVLASTLEELARGFDDHLEAFDSARVRIDALVAVEDARVAMQLRSARLELEYAERLAASMPGAADEVRAWPLPEGLEVGSWIATGEPGSRFERSGRLHYVSPMRTRFLFADRRGNKVFEGSRSMLARALRHGEVVLLSSEPDPSLFDRALKRVVAKLRDHPTPVVPARRRLDRQPPGFTRP